MCVVDFAHNELRRHRNTLVGTIRTVESFGQQSECLERYCVMGLPHSS